VIEPLRLSFDLDCPADHAFTTWTQRFSSWWPANHTVSGEPGVSVFFEPRLGGKIFERTPEGRSHEWGEITAWEPPRRLGYLWYLRRDRADATEVEIRFVDRNGGARVEIEHRGWERLGAAGSDWRDANRAGWASLLPHFAAATSTTTTH
jgi:Activator of Hsp90 ATPase homolog 1-like protein